MSERAEEMPDSSVINRFGPDFVGYYRAQVAELLGQNETRFLDPQATVGSSACIVGAGMSNLRRENLNTLLRRCVRDLDQEVDEMLEDSISLCQLQPQLRRKNASSSASVSRMDSKCSEVDDDIRVLLTSDTKHVEEAVGKYSNELLLKLENMEQQLEKLLDSLMTTCRPMARGEKRELQKSIKELPAGNLKRIVEIIQKYYSAPGKDFTDEFKVDLDNGVRGSITGKGCNPKIDYTWGIMHSKMNIFQDKIMLWRLYFYAEAVKNARKLAN